MEIASMATVLHSHTLCNTLTFKWAGWYLHYRTSSYSSFTNRCTFISTL